MFSLETALLGVALAVDAAVVSFAIGILNLDLPKSQKISRALMTCLLFGFFQALMIWLGSLGGFYFTFSGYGHLYQLIVALIFMVIGTKVLQDSFKKESGPVVWELMPLLILAVATSFDALASGVSMGPLPSSHITALEIGLITFVICGFAIMCSTFLKSLPHQWLLRFASIIFFALGGRILLNYL